MVALLKQTTDSVVNQQNLDQGSILVIDDHGITRQLVADILQLEGYDVIEADSGEIALDLASQHNPDLILLDIVMPGMNGIEICRCLKANRQTAQIPVILMTVGSDRQSRLDGLAAGGTDFLTKPLDRLELATRVKALIQHKRLAKAIAQSKQMLFTIAQAVEGRCCGISEPSDQLVQLVTGFGEHLQLSIEDIQHLQEAAYLHDIGAISIPDAILLKTDPLTPQERELIRQHVLIGEKMCRPVHELRHILPIIRHHHERWDGSGYPDGIAGEDIPWLAQIFQIADIYDALTSQRPHKDPLSPQTSLRILTEEAKQGWRNPQLVQAFCAWVSRAC